jgi:hypothetical protein
MIWSLECQAISESGSPKTAAEELTKYKSDGAGDPHVRWDTDGIEPTDKFIFFFGKVTLIITFSYMRQ